MSAGLQLFADQGGRAVSSFAVTFFHPGVYCLSAVDVQATPAEDLARQGTAHENVAIYPLYVLVNT